MHNHSSERQEILGTTSLESGEKYPRRWIACKLRTMILLRCCRGEEKRERGNKLSCDYTCVCTPSGQRPFVPLFLTIKEDKSCRTNKQINKQQIILKYLCVCTSSGQWPFVTLFFLKGNSYIFWGNLIQICIHGMIYEVGMNGY